MAPLTSSLFSSSRRLTYLRRGRAAPPVVAPVSFPAAAAPAAEFLALDSASCRSLLAERRP